MVVNIEQRALDILREAAVSREPTTVKHNLAEWPPDDIRNFVDRVLAGLKSYQLTLIGIHCDASIFDKLGIPYSHPNNSGEYSGVPVVRTSMLPFDFIEFVLKPQS